MFGGVAGALYIMQKNTISTPKIKDGKGKCYLGHDEPIVVIYYNDELGITVTTECPNCGRTWDIKDIDLKNKQRRIVRFNDKQNSESVKQ